jgi:hypothetical protein
MIFTYCDDRTMYSFFFTIQYNTIQVLFYRKLFYLLMSNNKVTEAVQYFIIVLLMFVCLFVFFVCEIFLQNIITLV